MTPAASFTTSAAVLSVTRKALTMASVSSGSRCQRSCR